MHLFFSARPHTETSEFTAVFFYIKKKIAIIIDDNIILCFFYITKNKYRIRMKSAKEINSIRNKQRKNIS
jgi:hypothetical protein